MAEKRKTHCLRGHLRSPDNVNSRGSCKECVQAAGKKFRLTNPERTRKYHRNWAKRNRNFLIDKAKSYRKNQPDSVRDTRLRSRYGLSLLEWQALWEKQKGLCSICRCVLEKDTVHTDHCHTTKKVRGLLCRHCNRGLGAFLDSIGILKSAILYLKRSTDDHL